MTRENQLRLVRGAVRCEPADAEAITDIALAARAAGTNCCVWHSAAVHFGTLAACPCWSCEQERKTAHHDSHRAGA